MSATDLHLLSGVEFVCDRENIVYAFKEYARLMAHWREVLPPSAYLEVRYESLVEEPEFWIRKMIAHCGLDWDNSCLLPEKNSRRVSTPSFWQVRQPVYKTSKDRSRGYQAWLGAFEELAGPD